MNFSSKWQGLLCSILLSLASVQALAHTHLNAHALGQLEARSEKLDVNNSSKPVPTNQQSQSDSVATPLAAPSKIVPKSSSAGGNFPVLRRAGKVSILIDGKSTESIWQDAPVYANFHQFQPANGQAVSSEYRTEVKILVDDDAFYFAIRAWDPTPQRIESSLTRRDHVEHDQDFVGILLDAAGHGRSAQFVRVNVAGAFADGVYRPDEDEFDMGPDFPIDAAVERLPDGYSIEVRWPLSNLRFPYEGGKGWRVMIERNIPHAEHLQLTSAALRIDDLNYIARMQELVGMDDTVEAIRDRKFVDISPVLSLQRSTTGPRTSSRRSLGVDVNARPRADWVFNAMINPDFSDIDIDEPTTTGASQLALSLPERRAFFLESLDVFGLPIAAFYSRTLANPLWGARATWRASDADATAMNLKDQVGGVIQRGGLYETLEVPTTNEANVSVVRGRWHQDQWVLGSFASQRRYAETGSNRVLGIDIDSRFEALQVSGLLMFSMTDALLKSHGDDLSLVRASQSQSGWYASSKVVQKSENWFNEFKVEAIHPRFVNDNGFIPQTGMIKTDLNFNPRWGAKTLSLFGSTLELYEFETHLGLHETRSLANAAQGQVGQQIVERKIQPGIWFRTVKRIDLWTALGWDKQRAHSQGVLHDVPAWLMGFSSTPSTWWTKFAGDLSVGRQLDFTLDRVGRGGNIKFDAGFRFNLPNRWALEIDQRVNRAWINGSDSRFNDVGWRTLATLHFNPKQSLRLLLQRSTNERFASAIEDQERKHYVSVLFKHQWQHQRSLSIAYARDQQSLLGDSNRTLSAKMQWFY